MLTTLVATLALGLAAPQTIELQPTDDIWVYPHASDPEKDGYLRCWGAEGQAVAANPEESEDFSYSYLKFDLSKLPKNATVKEAKLTLWHVTDPGWGLDVVKLNPLQVRGLKPDFSEKSWEYDISRSLYPAKENAAVFGSYAPEKVDITKPIKFEVDLLKGPGGFAKFLKKASDAPDRQLGLAITSSINPSELGQKAVYKFYSKDWEKADVRPKLTLVVE